MAYNRAVKENLPLLVWVGESCPACERQWTTYVHTRLSEYEGARGVEKGPCCIVCKPDGLGGLDRLATFNGIPSKAEVDAVLIPTPPLPQFQTQYQPINTSPHFPFGSPGGDGTGGLFYRPASRMFGGFGGGGCSGGG